MRGGGRDRDGDRDRVDEKKGVRAGGVGEKGRGRKREKAM